MDSFLSFLIWKWPKSAKTSYFMQFWPILRPYDPLKSPLHYQKSTLQGSYSPKSLHKFILSENGFTFIFYEVKMLLVSPKVDAGGLNPQKSNLKRPIKFGNVPQTSQFLVESCFLNRSRGYFTKKVHLWFYFGPITDLMWKSGIFLVFLRFITYFLCGVWSKEFLGTKNTWKISKKHFWVQKNNILGIKNQF